MNRRPHPYQGCALPTELPGLVSSRPLFCLATTAGTSGGAGAGNGIRTRDPQLGRLMLCQLSYSRSNSVLASVERGRYAHCANPSATMQCARSPALPSSVLASVERGRYAHCANPSATMQCASLSRATKAPNPLNAGSFEAIPSCRGAQPFPHAALAFSGQRRVSHIGGTRRVLRFSELSGRPMRVACDGNRWRM